MVDPLQRFKRPATTAELVKVAQKVLDEKGDLPELFAYRAVTMAQDPAEASDALNKLRIEHFKRQGKKPPEDKPIFQ
jgi:hypothetical protein